MEAAAPIPCCALAELPPVTREDVLEWFSLNRIYDSEEKRMRAVDRLVQDMMPPSGARRSNRFYTRLRLAVSGICCCPNYSAMEITGPLASSRRVQTGPPAICGLPVPAVPHGSL